ncbi:SAC3_1 [Sanghuangporus weigelae]
MADAPVKQSGAPAPRKVGATVVRGGRGGTTLSHSKNKTWVSDARRPSPASDGRWERGRGGSSARVRGGRGANAGVNGHGSYSAVPPTNATEDEDDGAASASEAGPSRLSTPAPPTSNGTGRTWEELVKAREEERARAIREGKMDDPTKPKRLEEAITMLGTCQDMCPEFERYRRERENNLDKWECIIGLDGKPTKKVDHARAVKIYERGQGDKIIPSDLRPPPVLKRTLDYLFRDLITRGGFAETQAFVRDRSRAVRNDFTIQQDSGPIAIECHERCTRFHILSLHLMYDVPSFDRALEIQQLMNSLLSLKEFYDDQRGKVESPNELEMRIYHRLGLIRDQHERNDRPPPHIAADPAFQLISRFRSEVQAASSPITKTSKLRVNGAAMQTFAELANVLRERQNVVMIYLMACFLEHIFGKDTIDDIESIRGALSIQDIIDGNSKGGVYIEEVDGIQDAEMDDEMAQEVAEEQAEEKDELSAFIQEDELVAEADDVLDSYQPDDGTASTQKQTLSQSRSAPGPELSSASPFRRSTTQAAFVPVPAGESIFGKIVSSSSTPAVIEKQGSSSVFGTAFNAFQPAPNVFGGPVFGVPAASSSASPKIVEPPKPPISAFPPRPPSTSKPAISITPSTSTILQETKPLRSLSDAGPLLSEGEEDRMSSSEAVRTPAPSPFPSSQSAPTLNPFAPSFEPNLFRASKSATSFPPASRTSLPPLRMDSPLSRSVDPTRGFTTPVDSPSQSFPSPLKHPSGSALSLDTGPVLQFNDESNKVSALDSPVAPPVLARRANISLPGTPTSAFPSSAIPPVEPTTPSTPYHFPALRVNISATMTSTPHPQPSSSPRIAEISEIPSPDHAAPSSSTSIANGKEPQREPPSPGTKIRLREQAMSFKRTHGLVPEIYRRWKQKMLNTKEWKEACRRSDEYKQRIHESSTNGSIGSTGSIPSSSSVKRQRSDPELDTEQPKRPRRSLRKVSNPEEQRTDEELAEKLMQNCEKNERRWAKGQFVKVIQEYVRSRVDEIPSDWGTWLCMNSSNDKTAIWLEQKFDVPQSGSWESESVFAIPISTEPSATVYPGMIVFECTPLEEVDDEIERKYRVLDDCSRLRDVISMLPEDRYYTPSLLFINWDTKPGDDVHPDISDMATKYVDGGLLRNAARVSMTSDDTDEVFVKSLPRLNVDLKGDNITKLTLSDLFKLLSWDWKETVKVWVEGLQEPSVNWLLLSYVVEHLVESMDILLRMLLSTWNQKTLRGSLLSSPSFGADRDDESVLYSSYEWLRSFGVPVDDDDDNPIHFFSELLRIALAYAEQFTKDPSVQRVFLSSAITQVTSEFKEAFDQSVDKLRAVDKALPRPSPRRKANGIATNGVEPHDSVSQASSPSPPRYSTGPKRARLSESFDSLPDTQDTEYDQSFVAPTSPTPSIATSIATSMSASVSAKMLRELSRDVLKKYGRPKRASLS